MDISKFNRELATKIAKAKGFEKRQNFKGAIEYWLEISELIIEFSKKPGLDFSYRNMLISKTEQIFQHVRDLKAPKRREVIRKEVTPREEILPEVKPPEISAEEPASPASVDVEPKGLDDENWMDKIDFKDPPTGVLEIEPSKDFKIVTPHDPNYVEKMKKLSEDHDNGMLKQQVKPKNNNVDNGIKVFCFACGAEVEHGAKVCNECGTNLG